MQADITRIHAEHRAYTAQQVKYWRRVYFKIGLIVGLGLGILFTSIYCILTGW